MQDSILKMIEYPKSGILSKEITRGKINATLFCMAGKSEMSEHTSTKSGIVYVLEGKGIFNLQGKNIKMEQGVLIAMKKNAKHSLKAVKNTSFLLILNLGGK